MSFKSSAVSGATKHIPGIRTVGIVAIAAALVTVSPQARSAEGETTSLSGNYLAGHVAQKRSDLKAAIRYLGSALVQDSSQIDVLRRTFLFNIMDGRMAEALKLARQYIEEEEKAPVANLAIAMDDAKNEKWDAVIERMSALDSTGLNGFTVPLLKSWALLGKGDKPAALEALKPLRDLGGTRAMHDLHAGLMHELTGDLAAAETYYLAVVEDDEGSSLRASRILGTLYERQGKAAEAKAVFDLYLQAQPGTSFVDMDMERLAEEETKNAPILVRNAKDGIAEAIFGISSLLNRQGGSETALVLARLALHLRPDFAVMRYMAGGILENLESYEDAVAVYRELPEDTPFTRSATLRIARNLDRIDDFDGAVEILKKAAEMFPDDSRPLISLGDTYRRHEKWEDAIAAYDEAVKRIGTLEQLHWQLLYSRGIVLERAKQWDRAEADFLKALEFEPDQPLVLNYLGYSWVEQKKNLDQALTMIKTAVAKRPHDGYITDSLGWVYYQFGRYADAVPELERAVELRPEDPVINDHLGDAYWKVGRRLEATFQWNHALALDPEPEHREKIEMKLKNGLVEEADAVIKTTTDGG
ncbi:MAG: tetratricopeptide repeat protein [Rhodospirillales bacterium]|nr:tetratricopeptide repeat protein [Rhodospirillales bacterium]MBO6785199.1 tetratricopeptide repeat protein [Rhodospirillales bacterium]